MMKWPKLKFDRCVTLIRGVLWGLPDAYTYTSREATGLAEFTISLDGEEVYKVAVEDKDVTCKVTFTGVALKRLTAHKKLADLTAEERALLDRAFEVPRRIRRELETERRFQDMIAAKARNTPDPSLFAILSKAAELIAQGPSAPIIIPAPSAGQGEEESGAGEAPSNLLDKWRLRPALHFICDDRLENPEIAQRLNLSEGTVRNYVSELYRIFEVSGELGNDEKRTRLCEKARERGEV